jgi:cell division control protein 6
MSIQHPRELFKRILITLEENISTLPAGDAGDVEAEKRVVGIVRDARQQTLIVLDEIDHLLGSRLYQNILYRLFSWPQRDTKTCAVIGLANSLDLTERFVPLLASKGAAPSVLHFRPFEAAEIKQVIGARLALLRSSYEQDAESNNEEDFDAVHQDECNAPTFFTAPALELLARKVAAATGDLRKALDTCRLAIEAVESEMTAKAQADSADAPVDLRSFNPTNVPRVLPAHILKVLSTVLGSPQLTKIRSLSLQPKLALLALLIAQKRAEYNLCVLGGGASSAVGPSTMGGVYASDTSGTLLCDVATTYTQMLKNDDFAALEGKELIDVLEGLEVEGVVRIVGVNGKAVTENGSQSERGSGASIVVRTNNISPSAKRAAKRQLLASYRRVQLVISVDDVIKGICTPPPPSRSSSVSGSAASGTVVLDAIKRIWSREEFNAERARGWQTSKALAQRIRDEELGGGRGALANI